MRRHLTLHLCCSSLNAAEDCRPEMMHWQNTSSIPRRLTFCKYSGIFVVLGDALGGLLQRNEACSMQPGQSGGFEAKQTGASAVQAQPAAPQHCSLQGLVTWRAAAAVWCKEQLPRIWCAAEVS